MLKKKVLIGSTDKCGTGVNVQTHLVAMHHVDCPWKPSSIEQREGRGIRQGNENEEVAIYRYVTKGTFDAYNWSLIENKQRFISQVMTSKAVSRSCEDIDEATLSYDYDEETDVEEEQTSISEEDEAILKEGGVIGIIEIPGLDIRYCCLIMLRWRMVCSMHRCVRLCC